jgi:hypothetical protein
MFALFKKGLYQNHPLKTKFTPTFISTQKIQNFPKDTKIPRKKTKFLFWSEIFIF